MLIFFVKPVWSLVVYCAVIAWYPIYLTVPVGTIDFTALRMLILVVFATLFLRTDLVNNFKFLWIDKLVIIYFVCQLLAGAVNIPFDKLVENRAGAIFDLVLPYFAVRLIVTTKKQYLVLLKGILVISAPLALIGFYESLTGHNPVDFFRAYCAWDAALGLPNPRSGFYRASFSFPHPITFGLFFAMTGPLCAGLLRNIKANKLAYAIAVGLMAVGVFSSMSSGPWYAAMLAAAFLAFYHYRRYWKVACAAVILMCLLVEVVSNRHFYEVIDRAALNSATAWYRCRLIEVALFEGGMSGHWLTGYGFRDPGWGPRIDMHNITDTVNHYITILCRYGLAGLLPFLAMILAAIERLVKAYRRSTSSSNQWLVWCLAATILGILAGANAVMLFGPARILLYVLLGFCGAMPSIVGRSSLELSRKKMLQY